MEEIIKKLCTSCICKGSNCIELQLIETKLCKTYKCLNYKQDISKIRPYKNFDYIIRSNNDKIKRMKINKVEKK